MADQISPGACPVPHGDGVSCPVPHGVTWDEAARRHAVDSAHARHEAAGLPADRAERMALRAAEERATARGQERVVPDFVRALGMKLGYGHPLAERTGTLEFTWTPEAEARLAEVPEFCRELTRWRVEWTAHKLGLGSVITPEAMERKYEMWGEVSHAIEARRDEGLPWTDSAWERFERVPEFVRGQVLEAVEGNARRLGATEVDDAVVDAVIARWAETGDFHEGRYGFR